jgi:NitT/TauT family transport system permease protein
LTRTRLVQLGLLGVLIASFELAVRTAWLDNFTFAPPSSMFVAMSAELLDPTFRSDALWPSVTSMLAAFASAALIGVATGVALWRIRLLFNATRPYLILAYSVPVFVLYPVFLSIFGGGSLPVIVVATIFALPAVILNTAIGFSETARALVKVGLSYKLRPAAMLAHIYFPAAWPHIFTGLRIAAGYSIVAVIGTEFILSTRGLGHAIANSYNAFAIQQMYGEILIVILLALGITGALGSLEALYFRRLQ